MKLKVPMGVQLKAAIEAEPDTYLLSATLTLKKIHFSRLESTRYVLESLAKCHINILV